jgi:prevent-host-death family protein
MQVALSELKTNVGKYVNLAKKQDIYITRNGKQVAKIIGTNRNRVADMKSLFGIAKLPPEYDDPNYDPNYDKLRDERVDV